MQDAITWVESISRFGKLGLLLFVLWQYYGWEARRDDQRKESAYGDHCAEPGNPVHLARFGVFGSMAASARTVANICFVGWLIALLLNSVS